ALGRGSRVGQRRARPFAGATQGQTPPPRLIPADSGSSEVHDISGRLTLRARDRCGADTSTAPFIELSRIRSAHTPLASVLLSTSSVSLANPQRQRAR